MIRFRRLPRDLLDAWLVNQNVPSNHNRYRLRVWREDPGAFEPIKADLIAYVDEAFDDARRRLRRGFEDDLSPFNDPATDPAANYPALLHHVTLQGYWGETLGVIGVEHWGAHGDADWIVPAFLFRYHEQEFQHLEAINERIRDGQVHDPDADNEQRPGRTGDDGLCFRISANNVITDILTIEAKCLIQSNNTKIKEAHEKLSAGQLRPSGVRELINILADYNNAEAQRWQEALLRLWRDGYRVSQRYDCVAYACGRAPVQGGRVAWMPTNRPHTAYTAARNLEGMEFQFSDLNTLISTVYRGA